MLKPTMKAKVLVGSVVAIVAVAGLGAGEYKNHQDLKMVQQEALQPKVIVITPMPSASPSATPTVVPTVKPVYRYSLPTKALIK